VWMRSCQVNSHWGDFLESSRWTEIGVFNIQVPWHDHFVNQLDRDEGQVRACFCSLPRRVARWTALRKSSSVFPEKVQFVNFPTAGTINYSDPKSAGVRRYRGPSEFLPGIIGNIPDSHS
jgi:hypothetical protein